MLIIIIKKIGLCNKIKFNFNCFIYLLMDRNILKCIKEICADRENHYNKKN